MDCFSQLEAKDHIYKKYTSSLWLVLKSCHFPESFTFIFY